jgi:hypothetical protein
MLIKINSKFTVDPDNISFISEFEMVNREEGEGNLGIEIHLKRTGDIKTLRLIRLTRERVDNIYDKLNVRM